MAAKRKFTLVRLIARLVLSLLLVFATYNPSGYSIFHWLIEGTDGYMSLRVFSVLLLLILYVAIFRAVYGVFRWTGLAAVSLVAVLVSLLVVQPSPSGSAENVFVLVMQYVVLVSIGLVMASGLSWAHLMQRLTGQLEKRYVRYAR